MPRYVVTLVEAGEAVATDSDESPLIRDVVATVEAADEAGAVEAAWEEWDHKYGDDRPELMLRPVVLRLDEPAALTPEQAGELDSKYVAFPAFADWPRNPPRRDVWDVRAARYLEAKNAATREAFERARQEAIRAAAFETGAIEDLYPSGRGLTFTVATQAAMWEAEVEKQSRDALALFRAQLEAYEIVLDAATQQKPITEKSIRELHQVLTRPQETYLVHTATGPAHQELPRGVYKKHPNHVLASDGVPHAYAPVADTAPEMQRLVEEVSTSEFAAADPVVQASYIHYAFVAVHPFADGNGRVARALASTYFYRAVGIPLLIFADQRPAYFGALALADRGDYPPFVQFIAACGRSGIELATQHLLTAEVPSPETLATGLRELLTVAPGLTAAEMQDLSQTIMNAATEELNGQIEALALPAGVRVGPFHGGSWGGRVPANFEKAPGQGAGFGITSQSAPPIQLERQSTAEVLVSSTQDQLRSFLIVCGDSENALELEVSEVHPAISESAQRRLSQFVARWLAGELYILTAQSKDLIAQMGKGTEG